MLAACAVITQSFPHPDEYNIPQVPLGRRAQYYVLHDDGDFKYGYDTGDGTYESAVKMGAGDLTGFFGYKDAFGDKVHIDYTAGAGGFQPSGNIIPSVPDVRSSVTSGSIANNEVLFKSVPTIKSQQIFETSNVKSANNVDGSYSFSYDNSDSSRRESADSDLNVRGDYSFIGDDGQRRTVEYVAGSLTGFLARGDHLPKVSESSDSALFATPTATVYNAPKTNAGQFIAGNEEFGNNRDASYSFNYQGEDSSRSETADSDLNVKGQYTFIADDGIERTVTYMAGSGIGFMAEGSHLPVPPTEGDMVSSFNTDFSAAPHTHESKFETSPNFKIGGNQGSSVDVTSGGDGGYSFSYTNADSSRTESADASNNVVGKYSFITDDGENHLINYRAGSGIGFVAEGDSIPVAEELSSVPVAQVYSAPIATPGIPLPTISEASNTENNLQDGKYSFSYTNSDSSRSESADSSNNVVGQYSYVADDGINRQVRYKAGSVTGFVAEGDSIPTVSNIATNSQGIILPINHSPVIPSLYTAPVRQQSLDTPKINVGQFIAGNEEFGNNRDASYSFNYQGEDSSRSETADSDLNVKGQYTFIADDGIERTVTYMAGSGIGFMAEGSHLPVPPTEGDMVSSFNTDFSAAPHTHESKFETSPNFKIGGNQGSSVDVTSGGDGGYSFSYTNADSSRTESADASNNVVGKYSFITDDGENHLINYRAGSGIGFVAEGDSIPVAEELSSVPVAQVYSAPIATPGIPLPTISEASNTENNLQDGKYSFSYTNSDSSRSESADSSNNVVGQYSYVADDGINRQVRYKAGSVTGFVAEGDSIPTVSNIATNSQGIPLPIDHSPAIPSLYTAPIRQQSLDTRGDSSYSFSYQTDDSERQETADSDLNIKGKYSFIADDGIHRSVNYMAGSQIGFVASGDHLPVAPEVPAVSAPVAYSAPVHSVPSPTVSTNTQSRGDSSYHFNYANSDSVREESADDNLNIRGKYSFIADDGHQRTVNYIAGSATGFVAQGDHIPAAPTVNAPSTNVEFGPIPQQPTSYSVSSSSDHSSISSSNSNDASYSFNYANKDSSRDEVADRNLNVRGHFQFVADDGIERRVNYIAGSATGFVAEGDHLPRQVVDDSSLNFKSANSAIRSSAISHESQSSSDVGGTVYNYPVPTGPAFSSHTSKVVPTPAHSANSGHNVATSRSATGNIVGNVLLNKYIPKLGQTKFGYVYTEI